jgi:hypothetical protein
MLCHTDSQPQCAHFHRAIVRLAVEPRQRRALLGRAVVCPPHPPRTACALRSCLGHTHGPLLTTDCGKVTNAAAGTCPHAQLHKHAGTEHGGTDGRPLPSLKHLRLCRRNMQLPCPELGQQACKATAIELLTSVPTRRGGRRRQRRRRGADLLQPRQQVNDLAGLGHLPRRAPLSAADAHRACGQTRSQLPSSSSRCQSSIGAQLIAAGAQRATPCMRRNPSRSASSDRTTCICRTGSDLACSKEPSFLQLHRRQGDVCQAGLALPLGREQRDDWIAC